MFRESLTQRKQPSHKLVFDNGQEIDLSQAGLISQARPIPQPLLKSPLKARSNLNSRTMQLTLSTPKQPSGMPGLGIKAATIERFEDEADDPLQRMVNLQREHSMRQPQQNRLRARNASAHHILDDKLKKKLKFNIDAVIGQESNVTSNALMDNQRTNQHNWQTKPSYASLHTIQVSNDRFSRSQPRGSVQNSNMGFSDLRSQVDMPSLPLIETSDRNSRFQAHTPFKRIIGNDNEPYSQLQQAPNPTPTTAQIIQQAEQSLLKNNPLSPMGLGGGTYNDYNDHRAEMIEEKRDDISSIIKRKQRNAALAQFLKQKETGNPIMTAYIGRQHLKKRKNDSDLNLPEISAKARAQVKLRTSHSLNSDDEVAEAIKLTKKQKVDERTNEDTDLDRDDSQQLDQKPNEIMDENREEDDVLQSKNDTTPAKSKFGTVAKLELETMKRAKNRGAAKHQNSEAKQEKVRRVKVDKEEKNNKDISQPPQVPKQSQSPTLLASKSKKIDLLMADTDKEKANATVIIKKFDDVDVPGTSVDPTPKRSLESLNMAAVLRQRSNETAVDPRKEENESIFDRQVDFKQGENTPRRQPFQAKQEHEQFVNDMKQVTDSIMIAPVIKNLGQTTGNLNGPILVQDPNSQRASPASPKINADSKMKLSFAQQSQFARQTTFKYDTTADKANNTATESNLGSQAFSTFRRGQTLRKRDKSKSKLSPSERSSYSEVETNSNLSAKYHSIAAIVNKRTALRIQRINKSGRKVDLPPEEDYIKKYVEGNNTVEEMDDEDHTETDSSLRYERQKKEEFNSELDLFSEVQSVGNFGKRRHNLIKPSTMMMKAIPAEDSADERGSESQSKHVFEEIPEGQQEMEGEEEEEYEERSDEANMNEKEAYKKAVLDQENVKKTDAMLCGTRLVKKIDDFAFQVSVEAGLEEPGSEKVARDLEANFGNIQPHMLETGNTSLFKIEKQRNDDQGQLQKVMDRYIDEFRGQQAFYSMCKMAINESKWSDPNLKNKRIQYFSACIQSKTVAKPILSKIMNKALVLRDMKLNTGDAMGLRENLMTDPDLINKLYLDENGLDGNQLAFILEGFGHQKQLVNLTIQGSQFNEASVQQIAQMLKRKVPEHLQELHLIHTKAVWRATDDLVKAMRQRNYLRKLSLVEAGLNDFSMANLCRIVQTQKTLTSLDISWNQLTTTQMRPLLEILKKNRRLTDLNLAWNNIMKAKTDDNEGPDKESRETIVTLGKLVKHSNTLTHINLSGTGLSSPVIFEFGTFLRRSRAVQVVHLSGNPGLNTENYQYLHQRIKCRANEDIERFTRVNATVKGVLRAQGCSNNIINGIKHKIERETEFRQVNTKDPIEFSVNDQLVFQRMLGHKLDIPGSGQWYESSKNAVACKPHYKHNCYICEGHVYCILFWSKGMCYKLDPILSKDKIEEIRFEIDRDFGPQEDNDLMYENTNVKYSALENKVPFVCGSFTGWRYRRMFDIEFFNERYDTREDAFELACDKGQIRKRIANLSQCNEHETRYVEIARLNEKLRLIYGWRSIFAKNLRYKRPFLMNSHLFYEPPSEDGTLPEDDHMIEMGEILSDTSSDDETETDKEPPVEEVKVKLSSLSPMEQEELKKKEEERRRNPLPIIPDETKFDKVFILPVFIKPGKHHYMIKYKDTAEPKQARLLKKIRKQERRYHAAKEDPDAEVKPFNKQKYRACKQAIAPECFFYHCDVPKRTEEVPVHAKPMKTKIVERTFWKDMSVFKPWRVDTAAQVQQAYAEDIKLWKGYRFIKSEEDREATEAVLKKYYGKIKDIFYYLAANSSWPNVGQLDFCDFAGKAKIVDAVCNISSVDRTYIAATLKVADSNAPSNGLRRFEFLEILVRLANVKYLEPKILKTYAEATEKLLKEVVFVNYQPEPWQQFRDLHLWHIDVNDVFEANLGHLKSIYKHYKTPTKGFMELVDVIELCTQDSQLGLSEKEISFCYGYSHMTIVNEERQWKKYLAMEFVEFLELIGRLAFARFKNSSAELSQLPLSQKIESILDDLFMGFGLVRNEVNIEVEEFSESDDDY